MKANSKKRNRLKAKILKASVYLALIVNMFSVCCVDSEGWLGMVFLLLFMVSGAWLFLMAWANDWLYTGEGQAVDGKWFA